MKSDNKSIYIVIFDYNFPQFFKNGGKLRGREYGCSGLLIQAKTDIADIYFIALILA